MMLEQTEETVRKILVSLSQKKYAELEIMTAGIRLKANEMAKAIDEYGRTIVAPPNDLSKLIDIVEVRDATPRRWSIVVPLWTQEEGRSDLSVELTVIQDGGNFRVELDDIHIL